MDDVADRPLAGILLRLLSGLLFTGMMVCVKAVSTEVPLGQTVFFRSLFALLPIVAFMTWRRQFPAALATQRPLGHLLRSGLGAAAMFASFAAVARLPVAEATLLAQLSPVAMAVGGGDAARRAVLPAPGGGSGAGLERGWQCWWCPTCRGSSLPGGSLGMHWASWRPC